MFIISGGRGVGKTRALLEKAKAENGIVICDDALKMRERAHRCGITGVNIMSYDDLWEDRIEASNKPVYIHDINKFISDSFQNIEGYTLSLD
jgi:hypothetical protein